MWKKELSRRRSMKVKTVNEVTKWECGTNEEWRVERANSIGASAVGALFGEDCFKTPMQVAHVMRAELAGEFDYTETEDMIDGHLLEDFVAKKFALKSGYKIIEASAAETILRREGIPFMHASLDRTYWVDDRGPKSGKIAERNKGVLECKTTRMDIDPDNLPVKWILQLMVQMGISGYHHGHIAWYVKPTCTFGYRHFDFDQEIFDACVEVCGEFWQRCIIGGEEPDPINAKDMSIMYPKHTAGKTMTVSANIREQLAELKEMRVLYNELEKQMREKTDGIKVMFKDEEAMVDSDGNVLCTYKTNSRGMRQLLIK